MRSGQSNKRSRGRGRKGPSPLSRSYESNGPDVKIRGTAQHIADRYINLARDAQSSGDSVLTEAYLQHAEHYYRIVALAQQQMNQPVKVKRADDPLEAEDDDDRDDFDPSDPNAPQPDFNAQGRDDRRDQSRGDQTRADQGRGEQGRGDPNRSDADDDGDRRNRRSRRPRRGRGDDERGFGAQADPSQSESGTNGSAHAETGSAEASSSEEPAAEGGARSRRGRPRRTEVEVSDRHSEAVSDSSSDERAASGKVAESEPAPVQASGPDND
jgi:hypothetical protein